nr:MAG TPA: hypothetical protein [Caudoviricetes sp.]
MKSIFHLPIISIFTNRLLMNLLYIVCIISIP